MHEPRTPAPNPHACSDNACVLQPAGWARVGTNGGCKCLTEGVAPPERVVVCETLAAMSILRHTDAVSIFPEPLLGHPETRGIVAVEHAPLRPSEIELLLLTQPDVPLTPAAEYFAHCLARVCGAATPG